MPNPEKIHSPEHLAYREAAIAALREGDTTLLDAYLAERESRVLTREDSIDLIVDTAMIYVEAALTEEALVTLDDAIELAEQEGFVARAEQIEALRDSLVPRGADVSTTGDTPKSADRPMGYAEIAMIPYEQAEEDAQNTIAHLERVGLAVPDELRTRYAGAVQRRKIAQYLAQITDGRARIAALKAINAGEIPPEVLKSEDSFIVEGTTTIQ